MLKYPIRPTSTSRYGRSSQKYTRAPMAEPELIPAPPDFIGVGTQRSGTTWWQRLLRDHPAIRLPRNKKKEQHFFDKFGRRPMTPEDIARYHDLFPRAPGELSGEWTPRAHFMDVRIRSRAG